MGSAERPGSFYYVPPLLFDKFGKGGKFPPKTTLGDVDSGRSASPARKGCCQGGLNTGIKRRRTPVGTSSLFINGAWPQSLSRQRLTRKGEKIANHPPPELTGRVLFMT